MATHRHIRNISPACATKALTFAGELATEYTTVTNSALVRHAPELARELPADAQTACLPPEPELGVFVIRGFQLDDAAIGATPPNWSEADPLHATEWDILLLLLASTLGTVFGWEGQQDGRLVHDIVPARGSEHEQTGASSSVPLTPHTEDAFHPHRASFLMLGCMRNHDRIGTTAACVRQAEIDAADYAVLSTPKLPILPDDSYGDDHSAAGPPQAIPTLWRNDEGTCVRYDPAYTPLEQAPADYRAAYDRLGRQLDRVSSSIALNPGEFLVIDNDAVVHGRVPFTARYNGTDRWLKRVNIHAPARGRPATEAGEHGYGQEVVDPYA